MNAPTGARLRIEIAAARAWVVLTIRRVVTLRLAIAVWAGVLGGISTWLLIPGRGGYPPDLVVTWGGARAMLAGQNPYDMVLATVGVALLYPLPASLLLVPFAWLSVWSATIAFNVLATAGVAWVALKDGKPSPLVWTFASVSYLQSLQTGQWSPWMMIAVLIPSLGFIAAAKPPMAFALWCAWPSKRVAISAIVFTLATWAIWPWWPADWINALRSMPEAASPPVALPLGFLLVAALSRWRRAEARLLFAMACVPQTTHLYGAVPLFLIPQTHTEGAILVAGSWLAKLAWNASWPYSDHVTGVLAQGKWLVWCLYLPCLVMVLRRRPSEPTSADIHTAESR